MVAFECLRAGDVVIPSEMMKISALAGVYGCLTYYANSKCKKELPKSMRMCMTASAVLVAGQTAYQLYSFNKDLRKMREWLPEKN